MLAMTWRGQPRLLAAVVAMAAVVAAASTGCAGSAAARGGKPQAASTRAVKTASRSASPTTSASASPSASPWPLVVSVPTDGVGQHQTGMLPPARSAMFEAEMTDLWAGVVSGRPDLALPAFFPLPAYEQVKAIADPAAEW
jgi:hypothetical protein